MYRIVEIVSGLLRTNQRPEFDHQQLSVNGAHARDIHEHKISNKRKPGPNKRSGHSMRFGASRHICQAIRVLSDRSGSGRQEESQSTRRRAPDASLSQLVVAAHLVFDELFGQVSCHLRHAQGHTCSTRFSQQSNRGRSIYFLQTLRFAQVGSQLFAHESTHRIASQS